MIYKAPAPVPSAGCRRRPSRSAERDRADGRREVARAHDSERRAGPFARVRRPRRRPQRLPQHAEVRQEVTATGSSTSARPTAPWSTGSASTGSGSRRRHDHARRRPRSSSALAPSRDGRSRSRPTRRSSSSSSPSSSCSTCSSSYIVRSATKDIGRAPQESIVLGAAEADALRARARAAAGALLVAHGPELDRGARSRWRAHGRRPRRGERHSTRRRRVRLHPARTDRPPAGRRVGGRPRLDQRDVRQRRAGETGAARADRRRARVGGTELQVQS